MKEKFISFQFGRLHVFKMYPRFLQRAKDSKITPSKFLQTNQIFIFGAKKSLTGSFYPYH